MNLAAQGLGKSYEGKEVLADVSLTIRSGGLTVVAGPNGAGKSTLLRILNLLEPPDRGAVLFDGERPSRNALALRRKMCLVLQNPVLFAGTVFDNVAYGLRVRKAPGQRDRVRKALSWVDLPGFEGRNTAGLSGGEIQRVALARALVLEPEVLFLDEPANNLDWNSRRIIEGTIDLAKKEGRVTLVLAAQEDSPLIRLAEVLYRLERGRITASGKPEEMMTSDGQNRFRGTIVRRNGTALLDIGGMGLEVAASLEGEVTAHIRPQDILLSRAPISSSARNAFPVKIVEIVQNGPVVSLRTRSESGKEFLVQITQRSLVEMKLSPGEQAFIAFKALSVNVSYAW